VEGAERHHRPSLDPNEKARGWRLGLETQLKLKRLREDVGRRGRGERAGHLGGVADRERGVSTTSRTRRNGAAGIQLDIGRQVGGQAGSRRTRAFAGFQGPFIFRGVNLAEVVDASIGLRGGARFHKVRNRDRGQQTDDGDDNHDFNQRETRFTEVLIRFHFSIFPVRGVNVTTDGLNNYSFVH
jgi:hypothetical protein